MEKKRIEWIDITKGIAILMVLYGHSMRDEMRVCSTILDVTYRWVYVFHMPYFFWLSGYLYQMGRQVFHKTYDSNFILKKARRQFLPWILYSILIFCGFRGAMLIKETAAILQSAGCQQLSLPQYFLRAFQGNNVWAFHLWFIYVLFLITLLIFLADQLMGDGNSSIVYLILTAICLGGIPGISLLPLGDWKGLVGYLCLYLPYYVIGIFMQGKEEKVPYSHVWGGLGILYVLLRGKFWSGFAGNVVETGALWSDMAVSYAAYAFLPGSFLLMRRIGIYLSRRKNIWIALIERLGKESFIIYLLHQPFCCGFLGTFLYSKWKLPAFITMSVCMITSLIVPLVIRFLYIKTLRKL